METYCWLDPIANDAKVPALDQSGMETITAVAVSAQTLSRLSLRISRQHIVSQS